MSARAPRSIALASLVAALAAACSSSPVTPPTRKGEGEACAASTECSGALLCLDGTCQAGGCSQASQCSGTPSASCAIWACVASRCVPGCSTATDAGFVDSGAPADVGSARDASAAEACCCKVGKKHSFAPAKECADAQKGACVAMSECDTRSCCCKSAELTVNRLMSACAEDHGTCVKKEQCQ